MKIKFSIPRFTLKGIIEAIKFNIKEEFNRAGESGEYMVVKKKLFSGDYYLLVEHGSMTFTIDTKSDSLEDAKAILDYAYTKGN